MASRKVPTDEYVRKAKVLEITDGDTVILEADLGHEIRLTMRCRLSGINAPEKNTKEGKEAKTFLQGLLLGYEKIIIKTYKDKKEKYGRYLAVLYLPDESTSINQKMIDAGHAKPYNGEKRT